MAQEALRGDAQVTAVYLILGTVVAALIVVAISMYRLWRITRLARKEHAIIHDILRDQRGKCADEEEQRTFGP